VHFPGSLATIDSADDVSALDSAVGADFDDVAREAEMLVGGYSCSIGPSMRYGGLTRDNPLPSSHSFSTVVRFGAKGKGPKSLEGRRLLVGASDGRKDGGAAEKNSQLEEKSPDCHTRVWKRGQRV